MCSRKKKKQLQTNPLHLLQIKYLHSRCCSNSLMQFILRQTMHLIILFVLAWLMTKVLQTFIVVTLSFLSVTINFGSPWSGVRLISCRILIKALHCPSNAIGLINLISCLSLESTTQLQPQWISRCWRVWGYYCPITHPALTPCIDPAS